MPVSFEEFYEILCVVRNEQLRIKEAVNKLTVEVKVKDKISFTLQEAADTTGFSYSTLYHMAKTGKITVSQPDGTKGKMLVTRDEILRLIEASILKV